MATHNPNQPTSGEDYLGQDNQFQQGAFKKTQEEPAVIDDDGGDEDAQETEDNPGDAYSRHLAEGGIYDDEDGDND